MARITIKTWPGPLVLLGLLFPPLPPFSSSSSPPPHFSKVSNDALLCIFGTHSHTLYPTLPIIFTLFSPRQRSVLRYQRCKLRK